MQARPPPTLQPLPQTTRAMPTMRAIEADANNAGQTHGASADTVTGHAAAHMSMHMKIESADAVHVDALMHGCMEGWMDGGQMRRWMDGWIDGKRMHDGIHAAYMRP